MARMVYAKRTAHASMETHTVLVLMYMVSTLLVVLDDLVVFYALFEVMLLLIYGYMHQHSVSSRSAYAMYMLATYTVLGSAVLAVAMILMYILTGASASMYMSAVSTTSHNYALSVAVLMHVAFYCKIPCYPMQGWLTEAHVESTTDASVLLAGIYLKVGIIG
eukprot:TRINITY_DN1113_c0_g2_i3.p1 TRINITY_DN1113_c0_g2~~TRINITY_DN1113_c0_g2_i3.p1  ORF type:complete len:163 (+),score=6.20 TRINITY_DN1113_c0_g2_i3:261-749(+)